MIPAFSDLLDTWDYLVSNTRSETTQQWRQSAIHLYAFFCYRYSLLIPVVHSNHTHELPKPDPVILAYYLCYLHHNDYILGTIRKYLSAVRAFYTDRKLDDPHLDSATGRTAVEPLTVLRGIKRGLRGQGRQRFPITRVMLQRTTLILRVVPTTLTGSNDPLLCLNARAAMCMAWFGLLRCSEFTARPELFDARKHVSRKHVTFLPNRANASHVEIVIPGSKVDPDPLVRQGFVLRLYRTDSELCPAQALLDLLEADSDDETTRPLFDFRTADERAARAPPRPTRHRFATHVSDILKEAGFDDTSGTGQRITTHSFRPGGAMALANAGVPTHVLQLAGRWRSNAFMFYITQPVEELRQLTTKMARAACHEDTAWGHRPPV